MKVNKKLIEKAQGRFLVITKDSFLGESFVQELHEVVPETVLTKTHDIEAFMETYDRGDLFGSSRYLIVLYDMQKEHIPIVESLLDIDTDDILVFIEQKTLPKTKAYTRIRACCESIKFDVPKEKACSTWVRKRLQEKGLDFEDKVPEVIVTRCGVDLQTLENEVKKLDMLCQNRVITGAICEDVVSPNPDAQYFTFAEHFFRRRVEKTLGEFYKVSEYAYVQLVHFMIGQVERLYRAAIFKEQGHNDDDSAALMGLPKFILKTKYYAVLGFYGKLKLIKLLDLFNELDLKLRTSKYSKRLLAEAYLLKGLKL